VRTALHSVRPRATCHGTCCGRSRTTRRNREGSHLGVRAESGRRMRKRGLDVDANGDRGTGRRLALRGRLHSLLRAPETYRRRQHLQVRARGSFESNAPSHAHAPAPAVGGGTARCRRASSPWQPRTVSDDDLADSPRRLTQRACGRLHPLSVRRVATSARGHGVGRVRGATNGISERRGRT
jgi:hypothetical protein